MIAQLKMFKMLLLENKQKNEHYVVKEKPKVLVFTKKFKGRSIKVL